MKKKYVTAVAIALTGVFSFPQIAESKTIDSIAKRIAVINNSEENVYILIDAGGTDINLNLAPGATQLILDEDKKVLPNTLYVAHVSQFKENLDTSEACELTTGAEASNISVNIRNSKLSSLVRKTKIKCDIKKTY